MKLTRKTIDKMAKQLRLASWPSAVAVASLGFNSVVAGLFAPALTWVFIQLAATLIEMIEID